MPVGRNGRRVSGFVRDFQEFALKGNAMDLAIGVAFGVAFGKIFTSMTEDIIMPAISLPFRNVQKASWRQITIPPGAEGGIKIGSFLGTVIDFLMIAFVLYLVIRAIARFKRREDYGCYSLSCLHFRISAHS